MADSQRWIEEHNDERRSHKSMIFLRIDIGIESAAENLPVRGRTAFEAYWTHQRWLRCATTIACRNT